MIYSTAAFLILLHAGSTSVASEAKIVEVNERGFVLSVDGKTIAADDNPQTQYWRNKVHAVREGFQAGDSVGVRIKTDVSPAELREIADASSWRWLEKVRKEPMGGVVIKADAKWLTVRFDDGSSFTYKITSKSSAQIAGRPLPVSSLEEGTHLYVKGRLTSVLDTSVVMVSDIPLPVEAQRRKGGSSALKLAPLGSLRGSFETLRASLRMFDVNVQDRMLHVTYTKDTKFTRDGNRIAATDIQKGWEALIAYRRDGYGRLIASKVELFVRDGSSQ